MRITNWEPCSRWRTIAAIAREAGAYMHSDGVQAAGKIPVDVDALGVDLYSRAATRFMRPKGVGALYVRRGTRLGAVQFGGHHERETRPGTENVPGAAAFGMRGGSGVVRAWRRRRGASANCATGWNRAFWSAFRTPASTAIARRARPIRRTFCFDGLEGEALVIALDLRGLRGIERRGVFERRGGAVARADGDRTDADRGAVQHPLFARPDEYEAQVDALIEAVAASVARLRRLAPVRDHV